MVGVTGLEPVTLSLSTDSGTMQTVAEPRVMQVTAPDTKASGREWSRQVRVCLAFAIKVLLLLSRALA
jgi:hypothetical protein